MTVDDDRSGVLLIRVWLEDGADSFRARLTAVGPLCGRDPGNDIAVVLASSPAGVCDAVRAGLSSFAGWAAAHARDG